MPVQVQLPGFQQREAPITGLAQVAGVASNAYHNYQENKLVNAQQANEELKNQAAQLQIGQNQQLQQKLSDPNSGETKTTKLLANTYLQGLNGTGLFKSPDGQSALKNLVDNINDQGTSGLQVHQLFEASPLAKSISGLGEAQAKANAMQPLAEARMAGVENQKDRIAANAADHFDKDPILSKITKQKQQVDLDKHTLETAQVLTPQIINEVQQGIANAISGGGSAGLGKTEQTEIQTAKQKIAELQQRFSSDPTPVNDPQLIQYFQGVLGRLGDAYDRNGYARAQQIYKGRAQGYKSNPAAVKVMQDKVESYRPAEATQGAPQAGSAQPPGGHMQVQQNGHTYNWNAQTGQYE